MMSLVARWLLGREKVRLATTPEEREALYRLRYEIYGQEKGWVSGGSDHVNKRTCDAWDEAPTARQLYVGEMPGETIKGTLRAQVFEPGQVPEHVARAYSLDRIQNIGRYRIADFGRVAVRPQHRGGVAMAALVRGTLEQIIAVDGVDLLFCNCRPHLLKYYRRMGFRTYDAPHISSGEGLLVPMIAVPSDPTFVRESGSVFAADAKHFLKRSGRPPVNAKDLGPIFEKDKQRVVDEAKQVFRELESGLHEATQQAVGWPEQLSTAVIDACSGLGYILALDPGEFLVREGKGESELFVLLEGSVEVLVNGQRIAVRGRGELLGEMAWLLASGRRTSSLRALEPCRALVLGRKFLDELAEQDPRAAIEFHKVIGRTLATRLAETNQRDTEARGGGAD